MLYKKLFECGFEIPIRNVLFLISFPKKFGFDKNDKFEQIPLKSFEKIL